MMHDVSCNMHVTYYVMQHMSVTPLRYMGTHPCLFPLFSREDSFCDSLFAAPRATKLSKFFPLRDESTIIGKGSKAEIGRLLPLKCVPILSKFWTELLVQPVSTLAPVVCAKEFNTVDGVPVSVEANVTMMWTLESHFYSLMSKNFC